MSQNVLFVSVNQSFKPTFSLADLERWVFKAWAISAAKAATCDRVVAVYFNKPTAAWRLRGAYSAAGYHYTVAGGQTRPRTALALGEPLPLQAAYDNVPSLRHGCAVAALDVESLEPER
ncbi:hypothetical protein ACIHDR_49600 [Nocardia sp. NPDC052278]|uniref:hypothetical protein n=1 Tax=unclassified Nocardia TaxID=2637762 RepID=UPI003692DF61